MISGKNVPIDTKRKIIRILLISDNMDETKDFMTKGGMKYKPIDIGYMSNTVIRT